MSDAGRDLRLLEALLFAAVEPLDEATIAEYLPDGADRDALLTELQSFYAARGINLVKVAGRWAMRTAADLAPYLRRDVEVGRRLSRAAVETLSIIAYHEPVTRAEIEEIRGVSTSRGTLDILLEAGWVKPRGRRNTPGRPVTWVTTDEFLIHFGLESRDDLPGVAELRAAGLLDSMSIFDGFGFAADAVDEPDEADEADESGEADAPSEIDGTEDDGEADESGEADVPSEIDGIEEDSEADELGEAGETDESSEASQTEEDGGDVPSDEAREP